MAPKLVVVSFMNKVNRRFAFLGVSAEAQGIYPHIIGNGVEIVWPRLGEKVNRLREFMKSIPSESDEDVVLFCDAFDVLVLGGEDEILRKFQELEAKSNRSLVFNAEAACYPDKYGICASYPPSPHLRRHLNSGLFMGRAKAMRAMLNSTDHASNEQNDQEWYQIYRKDHPDEIFLDSECHVFCTVYYSHEFQLVERRAKILETETVPPLLHFVSYGHWIRWPGERATSHVQDLFQQLFPKESALILENWWFGITVGSTHDLTLYQGPGFWTSMRAALCLKCRWGQQNAECGEVIPNATRLCLAVNGMCLVMLLFMFLFLGRCCGCRLPLTCRGPTLGIRWLAEKVTGRKSRTELAL